MSAYYVEYRMYSADKVHGIGLLAKNKVDAWEKAVFEEIPKKEGSCPYSSWVTSVTYNNGNQRHFNTFEGNPY